MNAQGQVQKLGTVLGVIQLGGIEYSIINEDNTNTIYKSAAHDIGQLEELEAVTLTFTNPNNFDQCEVFGSNTDRIFAKKVSDDLSIPDYLSNIYPTQVDDILYFDDKEHLEEFEDQMANYIKEHPLHKMNDLLDEIEASFNSFVSYRSFFNHKHDFLTGEFTPQEILDIVGEDCIKDEYLKTLFNHQKLIGIGDDVYFYAATGEIATVPKTNPNGIDLLRDLFDTQELDRERFKLTDYWLHMQFHGGVVSKDNEDMILKGTHYVSPIDSNGYYNRYVSYPQLESYCNPLYKSIRMIVEHEIYDNSGLDIDNINLGNASATLVINWGDGSPLQTINNYSGEHIYHTYEDPEIYYPITTITFSSPNGIIAITDGSNGELSLNTNISCTNADDEKAENYIGTNPNFMMTCVVWVNNGNTFNRLVGKTMGFIKNPNGYWTLGYFTTINTQIHGVFRDNNCNSAQTIDGTNTKHGDNFVQEKKTKSAKNRSKVGTSDVWSTHNMVFGPINLYHELYLNPCE